MSQSIVAESPVPNPLIFAGRTYVKTRQVAATPAGAERLRIMPEKQTALTQSDWRKGCHTKVRYETEAVAFESAAHRMATDSTEPLNVYECGHCLGFHLTRAADADRGYKVVPSLLAVPEDLRFGLGGVGRGPRFSVRRLERNARRHAERIECEQSRADLAAESRIDLLPKPSVASAEEIAAFFGQPTSTPTLLPARMNAEPASPMAA